MMQLNKETEESKPVVPNKVFESLSKQRTITLFGEINQEVAEKVTQALLFLDHESNDPIKVIINSQGGHVESGDTIFDMIRFVKSKVYVIGTGWVASAGALIYSAPPKKNRLSLPNTRFMLHQPMGGVGGSASDAEIEAREIIKMRERLNQTFADQTGQPIEKIKQDSDRNFWMDPKEAIDYGLVGKVIKTISDLP
jgi:ATP-dependent Clp protease protease subunit